MKFNHGVRFTVYAGTTKEAERKAQEALGEYLVVSPEEFDAWEVDLDAERFGVNLDTWVVQVWARPDTDKEYPTYPVGPPLSLT